MDVPAMWIPADAITLRTFNEVAAGGLLQWRGEWVMKSSYADTDRGGRVTPLGVILTGPRRGQWEPEINLPEMPLISLAPDWKWRPEIEGADSISIGEPTVGSLLYTPQGLAVSCIHQIYPCYAGLDGLDHYPVVGHQRAVPRAARWAGALVSPNGTSTWQIFKVDSTQQPS